ncbi:hypothetical protein LUZ61_007926 [Rhynchospora tenuis]|uniref:Uncharacterized protein n=1 Tax=Rhynchospora tenuis TaxID=198213 RepID=A0AAD5ZUE9_9POAL|nr:hypothetical protein LUZ61_007926 [Rhynchospora tenuis]
MAFHVLPELGITALHINLCATGGNKTKTPGPGAQSTLRALARENWLYWYYCYYLCLKDATPIPTDSTRRKGGRRGRRLYVESPTFCVWKERKEALCGISNFS